MSYPVLAATRWAAKNQAADRVGIARISAEETRRQVALSAAQAYLAVIAAERQREIAVRNLDTARALDEYARTRLEAGQGSRLNHVRSAQELATAEGLVRSPSCSCARPRRPWASPSSPTAPWTPTATPTCRGAARRTTRG